MNIFGIVIILPHPATTFKKLKPGDEIEVLAGCGTPRLKYDNRLVVADVRKDHSLITTDGTVLTLADCFEVEPTGNKKAVSEIVSLLSIIPKIGSALIRSVEGYGTWPPVILHHSPD